MGTTCLINLSTLKLSPPDLKLGCLSAKIFNNSKFEGSLQLAAFSESIVKPRLHVWSWCTMSLPALVSPVRGMNTTNGATMGRSGSGGRSRDFPSPSASQREIIYETNSESQNTKLRRWSGHYFIHFLFFRGPSTRAAVTLPPPLCISFY